MAIPVHIIVACDESRGIGKEGVLPWHIRGDLKHFKDITQRAVEGKKNIVLMGRKTWESIPQAYRPLEGRINVVLSRQEDLNIPDGVKRFTSFDKVLSWATSSSVAKNVDQIFVIGGEQVFRAAFNQCDISKLYMTHIHSGFDCDTFFPDYSHKVILREETGVLMEDGLSFHFAVYDVHQ